MRDTGFDPRQLRRIVFTRCYATFGLEYSGLEDIIPNMTIGHIASVFPHPTCLDLFPAKFDQTSAQATSFQLGLISPKLSFFLMRCRLNEGLELSEIFTMR